MTNFADRLQDAIRRTQNPTVLGLDPQIDYLPPSMREAYREAGGSPGQATGLALAAFNMRLIDALSDLIPAVKLQSAFYEQIGLPGLEALRQTIAYARQKGMLVIVDAKRNDIGSTAAAYARTFLDEATLIDNSRQAAFEADALTLNGYLGLDGIEPFLAACRTRGKGVFILVRTSNPSAGDLQDLVGACGYSSVGAVVGATWPQQAAALRRRMPHTLILVPGYGAQGAGADDAVQSFGPDGGGGLVNASRSLMLAYKKHQMDPDLFDLAARREALDMRRSLQEALKRKRQQEDPVA